MRIHACMNTDEHSMHLASWRFEHGREDRLLVGRYWRVIAPAVPFTWFRIWHLSIRNFNVTNHEIARREGMKNISAQDIGVASWYESCARKTCNVPK